MRFFYDFRSKSRFSRKKNLSQMPTVYKLKKREKIYKKIDKAPMLNYNIIKLRQFRP